jgi:hypothetical protein
MTGSIRTDVSEGGIDSAGAVVFEARKSKGAPRNPPKYVMDVGLARIGVTAEPPSVPVRAPRDTVKVTVGLVDQVLGVPSGGHDLLL